MNHIPHKQVAQPLVAVNLIFQKGDQVLLGLRQNTGYGDDYYNLVAGKLDSGETLKEAAIREAKEEVGVSLREKNLTFFMLMQTLSIGGIYDTALHAFFLCKKWEGDIVNEEPAKCGELNFFSLNALPTNTTNYTKKVLHYLSHPAEHQYYEYLERVL